jgi:hypothetical protein
MRTMPVVSSALLVLGLAGGAGAQESTEPTHPPVNVDQLPLNMSRIQRQLQKSSERVDRDGLNLKFFIAVYAQAPPIQLYTKQDNLSHGPVPYGAPTHSDMLQMMTPQEYRAPVADFGGLARWLANKAKK